MEKANKRRKKGKQILVKQILLSQYYNWCVENEVGQEELEVSG